ncbi:MAG: membrane bound O-acyl transferase family-domain-containing protein [Gemmataceae bacterium]|nr:membrane bound O-acyl transferase family-domain-containing protein [Gemmataceae bacterium]
MSLEALLAWPPWAVMWTVATAIFVACKFVTWAFTPAPRTSVWRHGAYLVAWPGLDAKAFLDPAPLTPADRPALGEWLFALAKAAFGVAVLWLITPNVPADLDLLRGWVGMVGIIFVLHFGAFHLLSCAWRAAGVNAKPLMNWPLLSQSVSEFWGKRWNTAFRDLTHRFLFRPLSARLGARAGLAAGFLFSGVVHDVVISGPVNAGYGWPTLYFVIQGLGLLAEKSKLGRKLGLGAGWRGRAFAAVVTIGPAYGLFHPPFVRGVVLPFLGALGAA